MGKQRFGGDKGISIGYGDGDVIIQPMEHVTLDKLIEFEKSENKQGSTILPSSQVNDIATGDIWIKTPTTWKKIPMYLIPNLGEPLTNTRDG